MHALTDPAVHRPGTGPRLRLALLALMAVTASLLFMTLGARGDWAFVLNFRASKLAGMLLVAWSVALSSVLFQTITHNRILTPSIMGFDALYVLIQALIIFLAGMQASALWPPVVRFVAESAIMAAFALALFRWLFSKATHSLHLAMLAGIVFGLLFRSLSSLMIRLIDPNEFLVLQDRMFASFNAIQADLLPIAGAAVALASVIAWRIRHRFDVLALGRDTAINLGVAYHRTVMLILVVIVILVSATTALVGPIVFFGLLVSNLAYLVMQSDRHRHTLPAAILLAIILLIGSQTLLERVLGLTTAVSVIIEFAGGLMFIFLVTRKPQS